MRYVLQRWCAGKPIIFGGLNSPIRSALRATPTPVQAGVELNQCQTARLNRAAQPVENIRTQQPRPVPHEFQQASAHASRMAAHHAGMTDPIRALPPSSGGATHGATRSDLRLSATATGVADDEMVTIPLAHRSRALPAKPLSCHRELVCSKQRSELRHEYVVLHA